MTLLRISKIKRVCVMHLAPRMFRSVGGAPGKFQKLNYVTIWNGHVRVGADVGREIRKGVVSPSPPFCDVEKHKMPYEIFPPTKINTKSIFHKHLSTTRISENKLGSDSETNIYPADKKGKSAVEEKSDVLLRARNIETLKLMTRKRQIEVDAEYEMNDKAAAITQMNESFLKYCPDSEETQYNISFDDIMSCKRTPNTLLVRSLIKERKKTEKTKENDKITDRNKDLPLVTATKATEENKEILHYFARGIIVNSIVPTELEISGSVSKGTFKKELKEPAPYIQTAEEIAQRYIQAQALRGDQLGAPCNVIIEDPLPDINLRDETIPLPELLQRIRERNRIMYSREVGQQLAAQMNTLMAKGPPPGPCPPACPPRNPTFPPWPRLCPPPCEPPSPPPCLPPWPPLCPPACQPACPLPCPPPCLPPWPPPCPPPSPPPSQGPCPAPCPPSCPLPCPPPCLPPWPTPCPPPSPPPSQGPCPAPCPPSCPQPCPPPDPSPCPPCPPPECPKPCGPTMFPPPCPPPMLPPVCPPPFPLPQPECKCPPPCTPPKCPPPQRKLPPPPPPKCPPCPPCPPPCPPKHPPPKSPPPCPPPCHPSQPPKCSPCPPRKTPPPNPMPGPPPPPKRPPPCPPKPRRPKRKCPPGSPPKCEPPRPKCPPPRRTCPPPPKPKPRCPLPTKPPPKLTPPKCPKPPKCCVKYARSVMPPVLRFRKPDVRGLQDRNDRKHRRRHKAV